MTVRNFVEKTRHDYATATAPNDHRPPCPCYGRPMIMIQTFEHGGGPRGPPRSEPGVRTAAA
jgi:hypothetical protein